MNKEIPLYPPVTGFETLVTPLNSTQQTQISVCHHFIILNYLFAIVHSSSDCFQDRRSPIAASASVQFSPNEAADRFTVINPPNSFQFPISPIEFLN